MQQMSKKKTPLESPHQSVSNHERSSSIDKDKDGFKDDISIDSSVSMCNDPKFHDVKVGAVLQPLLIHSNKISKIS